MIKTLQEICSTRCKVPEIIIDEIKRKTMWRLHQLIFQFMSGFNQCARERMCFRGSFIRDMLSGNISDSVDVITLGYLRMSAINENMKEGIKLDLSSGITLIFFSDDIEVKVNFIPAEDVCNFDLNTASITSFDWNQLINYCENKIHDPYHEFDLSSIDQRIAMIVKGKYEIDSLTRFWIEQLLEGNGKFKHLGKKLVETKKCGFECDDPLFEQAIEFYEKNQSLFIDE